MTRESPVPAPTPPRDRAVPLGWRWTLASLERLPQGLLSRGFGRLADLPVPPSLRKWVLGSFVRLTGIRLEEAARPLDAYGSVNELFVRRLAPGLRSWPTDPLLLASPVDGVAGQMGRIEDGTLVQAKGIEYRADELLGEAGAGARYQGGLFITLYLSPRHYHRIHTPLPGRVVRARHVPGRLLPVNDAAVRSVERLFATNERLVAEMETGVGRVAVVAVGATNVGRISAAFDPEWAGGPGVSVTNRGSPLPPVRDYPGGVGVEAGEELMAFHLGSTVVLLTEPGLTPVPELTAGDEV
ncbi:MAG: archaetidylserine decarboxylase, partial [Gemmatimonadota bacterium]